MRDLTVFEWLPDATVVVGPDGTVLFVNSLAARLLGCDPGALVGAPGTEVLPLRDEAGRDWWDCLEPLARDARLEPRQPEMDLEIAGTGRPVTVTAARVADGDGSLAALVISLRRGERRRRLDAARSELVSTVSHEIRSPLTSVKGFTKTLLAKWDRFTDDQKRQMLATVNEDADRVTRLLTELLDVSRIDARRVQLRRQMIDVAEIAQRVADRLRPQAEARPIECAFPTDMPKLYADPDKIDQIFTNLLENALKYGAGTIRIEALAGDEEARFSVADQGPGIPSDQLVSVFGKFFRRAGERKSGTGLGLYISKGLAQAHGGRMWATSEPGDGARFHFTLPRGGLELAGIGVEQR